MMSLNAQPPEGIWRPGGGLLDVVDVWYTVQGEGPFAGIPAIFVRLAGCNLQCPDCDTDYTKSRRILSVKEVLFAVENCNGWHKDRANYRSPTHVNGSPLVVVTGGEPFRQNLGPLCVTLLDHGYAVQIETNGTLAPGEDDDFPWEAVSIVCSPKAPGIAGRLKAGIMDLKYVVEKGHVDPMDGLPTSVLGNNHRPCRPWEGFKGTVWVQPSDMEDQNLNKENLETAVESCMRFGYRLCLQTHKTAGLK